MPTFPPSASAQPAAPAQHTARTYANGDLRRAVIRVAGGRMCSNQLLVSVAVVGVVGQCGSDAARAGGGACGRVGCGRQRGSAHQSAKIAQQRALVGWLPPHSEALCSRLRPRTGVRQGHAAAMAPPSAVHAPVSGTARRCGQAAGSAADTPPPRAGSRPACSRAAGVPYIRHAHAHARLQGVPHAPSRVAPARPERSRARPPARPAPPAPPPPRVARSTARPRGAQSRPAGSAGSRRQPAHAARLPRRKQRRRGLRSAVAPPAAQT